MNRIKAVLFDMDGTITNTLDDLADATNYALSAFGFKTHETDAFRYFVGDGIPKLIERALPEEKRDAETILAVKDKFFEYYNVHSMDKTAAYPGVPEVVKEVMSLGYKTAVVTNKDEPAAKEILSKLYPDCFDYIFGASDDIPKKPDPTLAHIAMKKLGVTPDDCVFVGDSCVDIQTAKNSGAYDVGVSWGFRPRTELEEYGATAIIDEPNELIELLKNLG